MPRLAGLQLLRAAAALLVLIGHVIAEAEHYFGFDLAGDAVPWSRGVDIFFVISGFIVTLSAQRFAGRPGAFLWRRMLRVVPLYYLFTTLMVLVLLAVPGGAKDTALEWGQIISSYGFFPFARGDGRIAPVLSLGWTLNYEVFFYLLCAAALAAPAPPQGGGMSMQAWSFVLQWARLGIGAGVFLLAARFLTLAEIGIFATAFAPVRLAQSLHRAGVVETAVITAPRLHTALFWLSLGAGVGLSAALAGLAWLMPMPVRPALWAMSAIPLIHGISAVSEGRLRRQLALRTVVAQGIAALASLAALLAGWGPRALVIFALTNMGLTEGLSLILARWWPSFKSGGASRGRQMRPLLRPVALITARDLLGGGTFPLMQLAIGAVFGLAAAGAFQIAMRMLGLLDALTLAPLRYVALPRFAASRDLGGDLRASLRSCAILAAWVWGGIAIAAPEVLTLAVGAAHAGAVAPLLLALVPLGLVQALTMPLTQALTARGAAGLVLRRAALTGAFSVVLGGLGLRIDGVTATAGLSLAAVLVTLFYVPEALARLGQRAGVARVGLAPLLAGGSWRRVCGPWRRSGPTGHWCCG